MQFIYNVVYPLTTIVDSTDMSLIGLTHIINLIIVSL